MLSYLRRLALGNHNNNGERFVDWCQRINSVSSDQQRISNEIDHIAISNRYNSCLPDVCKKRGTVWAAENKASRCKIQNESFPRRSCRPVEGELSCYATAIKSVLIFSLYEITGHILKGRNLNKMRIKVRKRLVTVTMAEHDALMLCYHERTRQIKRNLCCGRRNCTVALMK